jgi:hypothetical protein
VDAVDADTFLVDTAAVAVAVAVAAVLKKVNSA